MLDIIMDPEDPEIEVEDAKAADPGVGFLLRCSKGKFNAEVGVFLRVTYVGMEDGKRFSTNSHLLVDHRVEDNLITVVLPFGDRNWRKQINSVADGVDDAIEGFKFSLVVTLYRAKPLLYNFELYPTTQPTTKENQIFVSKGFFDIRTEPTAPE